MKTWILLTPLTIVLLVTATPVLAQAGGSSTAQPARSKAEKEQAQKPHTAPQPNPSTTQTGGSTKPSAVDPAQAHKTGANVGDGASYSRSTEKGQSTVKDADKTK